MAVFKKKKRNEEEVLFPSFFCLLSSKSTVAKSFVFILNTMVEELISDEKKLNKLADHLISPVGVPIREAKLVDQGNKDVLFFKGFFSKKEKRHCKSLSKGV